MVSLLQSQRWLKTAAASLLLISTASAQTYSTCNPTQGTCPADPALGTSKTISLSSGAGSDFTASGSPTYGSDGASFTVAKSGDSPQLNSKWYIMFGRVEITMKAAPGQGIVSSVVLQSDDLDEIDWEFLGGSATQVQSNYFGKGVAGSSDRAVIHTVADTQSQEHTYAIDWNANQIVWSVDGTTVRALTYAAAAGQYPQTPMQVKIGAWAGGDTSANQQGTVQWAGGPTNFGAGPFTMSVRSVAVTDYSTGTSYSYKDTTGTWQSIVAAGGSVNPSGSGSTTEAASPAITSTTSGSQAWLGTHRSQTTLDPSVNTNYPGLPAGWTVTSSGKVIPPASAGPTQSPSPSSPLSQPASSSASPSACPEVQTITGFDIKGLPTTIVVPAGESHRYDDRGFLITATPCGAVPTAATANKAGEIGLKKAMKIGQAVAEKKASAASSTGRNTVAGTMVIAAALLSMGVL